MILRPLFCFKDTKDTGLLIFNSLKQKKLIVNFDVNGNWKKLTDSRKRAKILADNRKSYHPIETLCFIFCCLTPSSPLAYWSIPSYHSFTCSSIPDVITSLGKGALRWRSIATSTPFRKKFHDSIHGWTGWTVSKQSV